MHKRIAKADILAACIRKQEDLIDNFNKRIEDVNADAYAHSEPPSQSDGGSDSPEAMLQVLTQELNFVKYEMGILRGIDPNNGADHVERGAVVVTNLRTFFISVSSEEMEVDGEKVFGMSDKAPLYAHMKGLTKGDSFQFNNTHYTIEDIY